MSESEGYRAFLAEADRNSRFRRRLATGALLAVLAGAGAVAYYATRPQEPVRLQLTRSSEAPSLAGTESPQTDISPDPAGTAIKRAFAEELLGFKPGYEQHLSDVMMSPLPYRLDLFGVESSVKAYTVDDTRPEVLEYLPSRPYLSGDGQLIFIVPSVRRICEEIRQSAQGERTLERVINRPYCDALSTLTPEDIIHDTYLYEVAYEFGKHRSTAPGVPPGKYEDSRTLEHFATLKAVEFGKKPEYTILTQLVREGQSGQASGGLDIFNSVLSVRRIPAKNWHAGEELRQDAKRQLRERFSELVRR